MVMRDGLVVVDKPPAWTSHDVVARMRKVYGQRRVGHAGTLDPDATGVLLVGLGRVTRLLKYLQGAPKEYRGTVRFGVATSTLDAAGDVLDRTPMTLTRAQVEEAAARFVGDIEQVPPMVSALKVGGRRLHELARAGVEVERAPRRVRIESLTVEDFEPGPYPAARDPRGVLVGHVRADARRRPRRGARRSRPPRAPPPSPDRLVDPRRGARPRRDRGRSRRRAAHPAPGDARPRAGRRRCGAGARRAPRSDLHLRRARRSPATGPSQSSTPREISSPCTSAGAPG